MKKFLGIFLLLLLPLILIPSRAYAGEDKECYVYQYGDIEIQYQLDENRMPYREIEGKKVPVLLPLEHMKIKDEELLEMLNSQFRHEQELYTQNYTPMHVDIAGNYVYEKEDMSLSDSFNYSSILKVGNTDTKVWVKTSDMHPWYSDKLVYLDIHYYSIPDDGWCTYTNMASLYTNWSDYDILSGQLIPYVYIAIKRANNSLNRTDLYVTATDYHDLFSPNITGAGTRTDADLQ